MADKTITQVETEHPASSVPDLGVLMFDNPTSGFSEGILFADFQDATVTDAAVAATGTVATALSNISTLTAQVAAVSTQSSLKGRRGVSTVFTTTSVLSDLWPADAGTAWVGDDNVTVFSKWKIINTSGSNLAVAILTKIAGVNQFSPGNITFPPTAASNSYFMDIYLSVNAGADGLNHTQHCVIQVRKATADNSLSGLSWGYFTDPVTSNLLDGAQTTVATATDFGTTLPSMEIRVNQTTATGSVQRIYSEEIFGKDH